MSDPCSIDIRVDDEGAWLDEGECSEYSCDYYHPDGHQFLIAPRSDRALALANIERLEAALAKVRAEAESWCVEHDMVEESMTIKWPDGDGVYIRGYWTPEGFPEWLEKTTITTTCRTCGWFGGREYEFIRPCKARGRIDPMTDAVCSLPQGHDGDHNGPTIALRKPRIPDVWMELGLSESGDKVGNPPAKPEYG